MPDETPERHTEHTPAALSTVLWKERQLLDLLLFKMEEEQLVLAAGKTRWVPHATREVGIIVEKLRHAELARAAHAAALAGELGLTGIPTLRTLMAAVEPPWDEILSGHHQAFLETTREISVLADTTRALAASQRDATARTIAWLTGRSSELTSYDASGVAHQDHRGHLLINEAL